MYVFFPATIRVILGLVVLGVASGCTAKLRDAIPFDSLTDKDSGEGTGSPSGFGVSISTAGGQDTATQALPIEYEVTFSEEIDPDTFSADDIVQSGTATGVVWEIINSGDNRTFTLRATSVGSEGTLILSIASGSVQTAQGGTNGESTSPGGSAVSFDQTDPTVTIDQAGGQADPSNTTPVTFTVVFSEPIDPATFTEADITQNGTATVDTWTVTNSGDDTTFTVRATVISADGTVQPSIAAGAVQDPAGNDSEASTSTDDSVTYDSTSPSVTVNQDGAQADPADGTPITFDVAFSEPINASTFASSDITQNGTATGITWSITNSGDDRNFTLTATAVETEGTVVPFVAADSVQDTAGNGNDASTSTDGSVTYVPDPAFTQIVAGTLHVCGLTAAGTAYCWGGDNYGQLGNGDALTANQAYPSPVDMSPLDSGDRFVSLSAGAYHTCGITSNRKAYCWGRDNYGQLGNGDALTADQESPSPVDLSPLDTGDRLVSISGGVYFTCGLSALGKPYCWGSDASGQLGNGDVLTADQSIPSPVNLSPLSAGDRFVSIQAGAHSVCGITGRREAFCWGGDTSGQLGNGGAITANQGSPSPVDLTPLDAGDRFTSIRAGYSHACGVTAHGKAYCWGSDTDGRLGNGAVETDGKESPYAVDISPLDAGDRFVEIAHDNVHTCGITARGKAYCWGSDSSGRLGNGGAITVAQDSPSVVDLSGLGAGDRFVSIVLGGAHTCALSGQGKAYCWGSYGQGRLGNGNSSTDQESPVAVDLSTITESSRFVSVSTGSGSFSCGLTASGKVFCWGWDQNGRLGNGGALTDNQESPSPVDLSGLDAGDRFVSVSAGNAHACGITSRGKAYCWGSDANGRLGNGNGTSADQEGPSAVNVSPLAIGERFLSISAGSDFTCGVTAHGRAFCWGNDLYGQLGNGGAITLQQTSPSPVDTAPLNAGERLISIAAGAGHACGISSHGQAYCWGQDGFGHLGNGDGITADQESPALADLSELDAGDRFVSVAAGSTSTCGTTAHGMTYCWGGASFGKLGNGEIAGLYHSPFPVDHSSLDPNERFCSVSAGSTSTCGVTAYGQAYCWGSDTDGRLGNGEILSAEQDLPSPVDTGALASGERFRSVSMGSNHACGVTAYGWVYCWGRDTSGEQGNGSVLTDPQHSPVLVDLVPLYE